MELNKDFEKKLKSYLTGKLDKRIMKAENKMNKKYPDEYYDCIKASKLDITYSGSNDPTSSRAIFIADIKLTSERKYKELVKLKNDISDILNFLNETDLIILKYKLRILKGGMRKASKEIDETYSFTRNRTIFIMEKLKDVELSI